MVKLFVMDALRRAEQGDTSALADRVRQGVSLTDAEREAAAKLIEGKNLRGRGRPSGPVAGAFRRLVKAGHRRVILDDLARFKRIYRAMHGRRCPDECALERVADRWAGMLMQDKAAKADDGPVDVLDRLRRNPGRYLKGI